MTDEDRRQFVRTETIPEWMAWLLRAIVPTALIAAVVAGLTGGITVAILKHDVGRNIERIKVLERWRFDHVRWGLQKAGKWEALFIEHDRRLTDLEKYRRTVFNNSWKHNQNTHQ